MVCSEFRGKSLPPREGLGQTLFLLGIHKGVHNLAIIYFLALIEYCRIVLK